MGIDKRTICVIPARGGSKRIPRKNIKEFCGIPIIAYSIKAALESGIFDEIIVSTDDVEIAELSKKYGASVPFFRSKENSDDYAVTADVLLEVISEYDKRQDLYDVMCCIYPTAPFVTGEKLKKAFTMFADSDAEMLEPVVAYSYPPQRSLLLSGEILRYRWPEYVCSRSQDLDVWYHDAGQFYFYDVNAFKNSISKNGIEGGYLLKCIPFVLDELEVQDIDNLSDWELAEAKYKIMSQKRDF